MKIFQREQRSLFGEILDWMLTPLLLLWPVSLALTWLVAQSIAGKPFDRALEYNVQALAQLVTVQGQRASFNLPQPAREILRADDADQIYYQVLGPKGELLSGERDFPAPAEDERPTPGETRLRDDEMRGLEMAAHARLPGHMLRQLPHRRRQFAVVGRIGEALRHQPRQRDTLRPQLQQRREHPVEDLAEQ